MSVILHDKKGVCGCEQVKDLEMGKLSWILRVGRKCNHMTSYEREAEDDFTTDRREGSGTTEQRLE